MTLQLIIAQNCSVCKRVIHQLKEFVDAKTHITLLITDINNLTQNKVQIVPALFINNELYSYGEFDLDKLKKIVV